MNVLILNQLVHLVHFLLLFALITFLVPRFFFQSQYREAWERGISDFLKMSVILIVMGYVLVLFHLFEFLSISFLLIFIGFRIYKIRQNRKGMDDTSVGFEAMIYDYFDRKFKLKDIFANYLRVKRKEIKIILNDQFSPRNKLVGTVGFLGVLLVAVYTRFYEGFVQSSLSYADRYSTLKWIKDIRSNLLFSDGILPQGFHIFWASIEEFTRMDTLYIIQFTGPFTQVLVMFSIYFFLSRLTGNRISGLIGMINYSLIGEFFDKNFWEWQIETSARAFVHVFFLPTLYFYLIYMKQAHKDAFLTMIAGFTVIAFIEPVFSLYLLVSISLISIYLKIAKMKSDHASFKQVYLMWGASLAVSFIPIVVGIISGKAFHISFVESLRIDLENTFLLTEQPSILPLIISVAVGLIWIYLFRFLSKKTYHPILENSALVIFVIISLLNTTFRAPHSIQIDWDATIQQYIRINSEISPRNWMIVGKEPLSALVVGRGYHMNIEDLVTNYDPAKKFLTRFNTEQPDWNIAAHVFFVYEKKLRSINGPIAAQRIEPYYDRWQQSMNALNTWLGEYLYRYGQEIETYYEDENIVIYHLEREQAREEIQKQIWGAGD